MANILKVSYADHPMLCSRMCGGRVCISFACKNGRLPRGPTAKRASGWCAIKGECVNDAIDRKEERASVTLLAGHTRWLLDQRLTVVQMVALEHPIFSACAPTTKQSICYWIYLTEWMPGEWPWFCLVHQSVVEVGGFHLKHHRSVCTLYCGQPEAFCSWPTNRVCHVQNMITNF